MNVEEDWKTVIERRAWLPSRPKPFRDALLNVATRRDFSANTPIFRTGEAAEGLYGILSGSIFIAGPADNGEELTFDREAEGVWVGARAILGDGARVVTVTAATDVVTAYISHEDIQRILRQNPEFYADFMALSQDSLMLLLRLVANLAVARTEVRLGLRLLHLQETTADHDGWIDVSQDRLAEFVAVSLPTVQRTIRKLADLGLVQAGYGRVRIKDRAALLLFCQG